MTFLDSSGLGRQSPSHEDALSLLRSTNDVCQLAELYGPLDAPVAEGLTGAEALAIFAFTSPDHKASRINRELCSGQPSAPAAAFADLLDSALRKLRPYQGPVFRSIVADEPTRFLDELCIGRAVCMRGFTSASWSDDVFSNGNVHFTIRATRASIVWMWASRAFTDKVVFPRGSRFEVRSAMRIDGHVRITLKELTENFAAESGSEGAFIPTLVSCQSAPPQGGAA